MSLYPSIVVNYVILVYNIKYVKEEVSVSFERWGEICVSAWEDGEDAEDVFGFC